ncbi:tyrosine-type recombinase/integrase [Paracoccus sp. S-4012]|uniref:tyrosine-type recombinase/integrase n=1 Tax=Paracoccus sp. S-4012 TaxID=2665648 RepID=UPI001E3A1F82|nr:tyrosine-type recombinase/integrase [Paracoccus sp. S-4012]
MDAALNRGHGVAAAVVGDLSLNFSSTWSESPGLIEGRTDEAEAVHGRSDDLPSKRPSIMMASASSRPEATTASPAMLFFFPAGDPAHAVHRRRRAPCWTTWDREDLERRRINLRLPDSRTRKGRAVVPINDTMLEALKEARRAALSDHVIEWSGEPVKSIRTGFKAAVKRAWRKDVGQHTLRHTAAVHMVEAAVPFDEVAQFLGHSNPSITFKVYGRFSPSHLRRAASALEFGAAAGLVRFDEPLRG